MGARSLPGRRGPLRRSAILPGMTRDILLLATLGLFVPFAAAADAWQPGTGFQTGGVHFYVVSTSAEAGALFRVTARLAADGVEEHASCYRVARAYYHVEACPVLQAHFARSGARAEAPQPAASSSAAPVAAGSHPIDYLRGGYVEPRPSYGSAWDGVYYGAWLADSHGRARFGGRSAFGPRGHRGRFQGAFFHGPGLRISFRRW